MDLLGGDEQVEQTFQHDHRARGRLALLQAVRASAVGLERRRVLDALAPVDRALGAEVARRYNEYQGDANPAAGVEAQAYLPAVPFEDRASTTTSTSGPGPTSRLTCLTCHRSGFPGWEGTPHARSAEVSCQSCHGDSWHDAKGKAAKKRGESACASCHVEQVSEFRRVYSHPVLEGRMGCASCHDVHGKSAGGKKGPEATCLECHPEAAGPWVFPHRAMEDGCSSCHVPHG